MAIEDVIARGVTPPQVDTPTETAGRMFQLRNMAQQGQMQDLAIQQQRQALDDQRNTMRILQKYQGNIQQALPELSATISPKSFIALRNSDLETREKLATIDEKQLKIAQDKNERLAGLTMQASSLAPDAYAQAWPQIATAANALHPELKLDPNSVVPQAQLSSHMLGLQTEKHYLDAEAAKRAAAGEQRAQTEEGRKAQLFPSQLTKAQSDAETAKAQAILEKFKAENGIVGAGQFETVFLPAYAANLGKSVKDLTPQEKMASFQVFKKYDTNPEVLASMLASQQMTRTMHEATLNNQQFQRGQQSYQFHAGELERAAKPIGDLVGRFGRLQDSLAAGTPQADALIAPELLSVMAGGQGSGLRMNEAEIARIVGGRSKWETLKASINQWQLDPSKANSITPEQRQEVRALTAEVGRKLQAKQSLIDQARQQLAGSNDPMEHRRILSGLNSQLTSIDAPKANPGGPSDYIRTATGKDGHKIGQKSDGSWYDFQTGSKL